jgi:ATP-dependent helicase/nuclease subunit B
MGIKALIGPAGSGKTQQCISALCEAELAGRQAVLVVPDQFTYAADRLLLANPALAGTRHVAVMSFQRLTHHIMSDYPHQPRLLSEQGRRMLLRHVVDKMSVDALGSLARIKETLGFVDALATTVKETKGIAGPDAADRLLELAATNEKIAVVGEILKSYDQFLDQTDLIDPEEWVHAAAEHLTNNPSQFHDIPIWIDGFASFTPGDKVLLAALDCSAPEVCITVCADTDDAALALSAARDAATIGASPLSQKFFHNLEGKLHRPAFLPTLRSLIWLFDQFDNRFTTPEFLASPARRFQSDSSLAALEHNLFRSKETAGAEGPPEPTGEISITAAGLSHPYQEVVAWARWIDHWTRLAEKPVRYRDIAVVIRNSELYTPLINEVFQRYEIPFFADRRRDATAHPVLRLALAALRLALQGWSREAVVAVLRNPLLALTPETVDRLENLSLEYGIEYERWWKTDWRPLHLPARETPTVAYDDGDGTETVIDPVQPEREIISSPEGSGTIRFDAAKRRRELTGVDALRISRRFFPGLQRFTSLWAGGGQPSFTQVANGLRFLISDVLSVQPTAAGQSELAFSSEETGALDEALIERLTQLSFPDWEADENGRVYTLLRNTLATGEEMMGSTPVTAGLVTRLLREAFSNATIGNTPRILDAVIIGEPRRSRVNEVRRMIIGGLDAASVPRSHTQDPLFSDREREQLSEHGLPLAATAALQAEEETYLFYIACTRATEEIRFTYATADTKGSALEPSAYLSEVHRAVGRKLAAPQLPRSPLAACHRERELAPALAVTLIESSAELSEQVFAEAEAVLPDSAEAIRRGRQCLSKIQAPLPERLGEVSAAAICPEGLLTTSASRLEEYAKCPFRHYARHLLKLEPRPEATLTPRSTGSAVHEALQQFFSHPSRPDDGDGAAELIRQIYADLSTTENYRIFQEDPPSAYRWQRTGYGLEMFIRTEVGRLHENGFQPVVHELAFGLGKSQAPEPIARALIAGEQRGTISLPPLDIVIPEQLLPRVSSETPPPKLRLRGMIDRLDIYKGDELASGGLVIDYKANTAGRNVRKNLLLGLDLQLAVYLLAISDILRIEPAGGLYYGYQPKPQRGQSEMPGLNPLALGMDGIFLSAARDDIDRGSKFLKSTNKGIPPSETEGIAAELSSARRQITSLAARIMTGEIKAWPAKSGSLLPCEYCEFTDLCRFNPRCHSVRNPVSEEESHVD